MKISTGAIQVVLVLGCALLPAILAKSDEGGSKRVPKQIHTKAAVVDSEDDHSAAETGFGGGGGVGGHGKYFQDFYMLLYGPLQMEYGHVCEDPDRWEERFERKDFKNNRHQGQARWGDKHGGYGEHYWDYNHAGHHEDGGDDGGDGGYSEPVPEYKAVPGIGKVTAKRQSDSAAAPTAAPAAPAAAPEGRVKKSATAPRLVLDVASGRVVDEVTGQEYELTPVN